MAFDLWELCLLVVAILILHKIGDAATMEGYAGGSASRNLGTLAFVLFVISGYWTGRITDSRALTAVVIRGVVVATLVSGFAKLLLPSGRWLLQFVKVPLQQLKARRVAAAACATSAVPVAPLPQSSNSDSEDAAANAKREADEVDQNDRRRVAARFECQMLYDQFSHEISQRFPQERLSDYFTRFMNSDQPVEEIERRAGKLQELIIAFSEASPSAVQAFTSVVSIREHYQCERDAVMSAEFGRDEEDSWLKQLAIEENRAMREFRQK